MIIEVNQDLLQKNVKFKTLKYLKSFNTNNGKFERESISLVEILLVCPNSSVGRAGD